jgi:hypothetical protein
MRICGVGSTIASHSVGSVEVLEVPAAVLLVVPIHEVVVPRDDQVGNFSLATGIQIVEGGIGSRPLAGVVVTSFAA